MHAVVYFFVTLPLFLSFFSSPWLPFEGLKKLRPSPVFHLPSPLLISDKSLNILYNRSVIKDADVSQILYVGLTWGSNPTLAISVNYYTARKWSVLSRDYKQSIPVYEIVLPHKVISNLNFWLLILVVSHWATKQWGQPDSVKYHCIASFFFNFVYSEAEISLPSW